MSTTYLTVRDSKDSGSKAGSFYINEHDETTGRVTSPLPEDKVQRNGWGQHSYNHKRQARRAAKRLAANRSILYRQDKEYVNYNEAKQIVVAPVPTTSPLV